MAERLGPYEIVGELGRGGAAVVHRALHAALDRPVALKVIRDPSAHMRERFAREARATAKLRHPNIVTVFDAGEADEAAYIAMELVEGCTLAQALRDGALSRRARVAIVATVAEAVQHAHAHGVVHRDLKPGNVLIDGAGEPHVVDFGLARLVDAASKLTRTGAIIGTPRYMSPEQVGGREDAGPPSDVWALGVILHECVAGRAPFCSERLDELFRLILLDNPPRTAGVPRDLETIWLKALEKEPRRRYATAGALATDLRQWLAGNPIGARRTGTLRRLVVAASRRPAIVVGLVAALAAGAATVALLAPRLRRTEERLTAAEESLLRRLRETTDAYLELALARRRAGDLAGMREIVPRIEEACRECAAGLPRLSEPHRRLARAYRAAMRYDEALAAADEALRRAPDDIEARYERGFLRSLKYDACIERARMRWLDEQAERVDGARGRARPPPPRAELENDEARAWRAGAEADLEASPRPAARALATALRGDDESASALFAEEVARNPNAEEAYESLARIARARGDTSAAADWYERGLARDAGYVPLAVGCAELGLEFVRTAPPGEPEERFAWTERAADRLVRLAPDADAYELRGSIRAARADRRAWALGRAPEEYARAQQDYDEAIARAPTRAKYLVARGRLRLDWAESCDDEEAARRYAEAVADFDAAERLDPASSAVVNRGRARIRMGLDAANRGQEAGSLYRAALSDLESAVRRDPMDADAWSERAWARIRLGLLAESTGDPADEHFSEAMRDADEALRLAPGRIEVRTDRAEALGGRARCAIRRGEDAIGLLHEALSDFNAVLRAVPDSPAALDGRAGARNNLGLHLDQRGEGAGTLYQEALADIDAYLRARPHTARMLAQRSVIQLNEAERAGALGHAVPEYRRAIADAEAAIRLRPSLRQAYHDLGMARGGLLKHLRNAKPLGDPELRALARSAIDAFTESLRRNPDFVESLWRRAQIHYLMKDLRAARDDFNAAVRADARLEPALRPFLDNIRARLGE